MMKSLAAAAMFIALTNTVHAGSLDDPIVEPVMAPVMIEEEAASSSAPSGALVITLATIAVFGAALAN